MAMASVTRSVAVVEHLDGLDRIGLDHPPGRRGRARAVTRGSVVGGREADGPVPSAGAGRARSSSTRAATMRSIAERAGLAPQVVVADEVPGAGLVHDVPRVDAAACVARAVPSARCSISTWRPAATAWRRMPSVGRRRVPRSTSTASAGSTPRSPASFASARASGALGLGARDLGQGLAGDDEGDGLVGA